MTAAPPAPPTDPTPPATAPDRLEPIRRRFAGPPLVTEESIALRIAVQSLVTIGIVSLVIASLGVTTITWVNLLAIPASALGATWSWYRRRDRNIPVKFCIAMGMLIALSIFFSGILAEPGDTRIRLAELLIHLQVLHSFDLPRRKDLGYSMMIGLILMGVAATVSQTLTFGGVLLLFLAIALPVLVLDYRSRLGLLAIGWGPLKTGFSPRRLGLVFLATLSLGLLIFAFMPRLPGYQLRSFPVSANIDIQGEFNSGAVSNPGYAEDGDGVGDGTGSETEGPGTMNTRFYYGFNERINLNLRGQMIPEVVMRVRSQAEGFWRVMAFDQYNGQSWQVSRNDDVENLQRPNWTYRFILPNRNQGPHREIIQTYTVVADLPNLIPALYEPQGLYFPTNQVAIDPEGALRAPLNLTEGMTYTVISDVPQRDRTLLQAAGNTYPDDIQAYYLAVPPTIAARVRDRALELLSQAESPITQPYEQALYLAQALKQQYTVQVDLPFLGADEDLVDAFLFRYGGGYPDHFSTVLTIMLRSLGIPARLVVGFGAGEFNPFTGFYVVRNTDAYAMTEVYIPEYGWFAFDPIPGHEVIPPSFEDYEAFSLVRRFWRWVASWLPSPLLGILNGLLQMLGQAIAWFTGLFSRGWIGVLVGSAVAIAIGFGGWLLWSLIQVLRYQRWIASLPPMEQLYQQMLRTLAADGLVKPMSQTPFEYAQRSRLQCPPERAAIIDEISAAYVHWRYGQAEVNLDYLRSRLQALQRRPRSRRSSPSIPSG